MIEQGAVYWADMNPPRKTKPGKVRPVLVVQATDLTEAGKPNVTVVPLTTNLKPSNRLRVRLSARNLPDLKEDSDILVDEIHTVHRSLLLDCMGRVKDTVLADVLQGILFILGVPRLT